MSHENSLHGLRQEQAVAAMLRSFDVDLSSESLSETPARVARMYRTMLEKVEPPKLTTFPAEGDVDQVIVLRNIRFASMCEHHMLPFFGTGVIAYLPGKSGRIVGLSKLARTLEHFSRGLQVQERITAATADYLMTGLEAKGVIVMLRARHLCMEVRGVHKEGTETITQAIRGTIDKHEVMALTHP